MYVYILSEINYYYYTPIRCTEPTERHEDLSGDRHEGRILACQIFRRIVVYLYVPHSMGTDTISRMPFGISSATEVMQKRNEEAFADPGRVIADDLIIAARNEIE